MKLSDFKGKYVLLDFWASWCVPCRKEHPLLVSLYEKYKSSGLEILGVSLDVEANKESWIKAIENDKVTWTQVSDLKESNEAAALFDISAVPANFLIDPSGKIIAKNIHKDELVQLLQEILAK